MSMRRKTVKKLITFIGLTFLMSSVFYFQLGRLETAKDIGGFLMWSPGLAAFITQLAYRDPLRDFGWKISSWKYLLWGLAIALIYAGVIYSIVWMSGLGGYQPIPVRTLIIYLTAGLGVACFTALGEEIGWRGFLVPELLKVSSARKTALISGVIWAVWHYPVIIFGDYRSAAPLWFQLSMFTISVVGMGILTTWLRLRSGSIWPAVVWHGAHNLFVQQIFLSMTFNTWKTEYFVDDFGIGLSIAFLIIGVVYWRRLKDKTVFSTNST